MLGCSWLREGHGKEALREHSFGERSKRLANLGDSYSAQPPELSEESMKQWNSEKSKVCACDVTQTLKFFHSHEPSLALPCLPFGDEENNKRNCFVFCTEVSLMNRALLSPALN